MPPTKDERQIIDDWLQGLSKDGSAEDLRARWLIANMLRHGPLTLGLRVALATLIDPETRDVYGWWLAPKHPRGAKPTANWFRVASIIEEQVRRGIKKEAAVADAMKKCGIKSRDKAIAAHKKYKPMLDRMRRSPLSP
jgi:hypothetical protein